MSLEIRLIGQPRVIDDASEPYKPRSRKTWGLLAFLLLSERPASRSRLSSLLFGEADDPLRALRWNLSEVRRLIGPDGTVGGNPVQLTLPTEAEVDVHRIQSGMWAEALSLDDPGAEMLDGFDGLGSPEFELWLLGQRRRIAASTEALLHEAVLALLGKGEYDRAIPLAESMVAMNAFDESHQAVLIRAYAIAGDSGRAEQQLKACTKLFADEMGIAPGPAIRAAALASPPSTKTGADSAAVNAIVEAGLAAMAAGAPEAGVISLRSGVALADALGDSHLRAKARMALADALVHAVRGDDEEGALLLHEVEAIANGSGYSDFSARARIELGFIDMLAARYDRAEQWLTSAEEATSEPALLGRARAYMGVVESDRADYGSADNVLTEAVALTQSAGDQRREAYATSILGRGFMSRGDLGLAVKHLQRSIQLGQDSNWLAFLPWPQALLGEALIETGDLESASSLLEQAFARACQIGDPCWEGVSARGLALLAEQRKETEKAFIILTDAAQRCVRLSDTYRWGEAYILDARCRLGLAHDHDSTPDWIDALYDLSSRTGMRELTVRALFYKSRQEGSSDLTAVANLAGEISNPRLQDLVSSDHAS